MTGAVDPPTDGAPDPVVLAAQVMQARRDDFIARLVATTEAEISQLEHDAPLSGFLEASITENIVPAVHVLINGIDPQTVDAPASAVTYARRLAQRHVPLSALLRAYRLGHAQSLDLVLGEAVRLELPDRHRHQTGQPHLGISGPGLRPDRPGVRGRARTLGGQSPRAAPVLGQPAPQTLRVFLSTNRSYVATADQLVVHRNTVHYRVQRAVDHYQSVPSATPTRGWYAPRR
ncbi:helix-turn-helix domain-containing protein [Streptomyces sp. NPDC088810]|uniref:helix-turn-helix domain-containing protein n=1 Tax=Streptomyces sp. NPDC088810 TaxID=3365904 RepID=UPI00380B9316